jgi:hypothetical protein
MDPNSPLMKTKEYAKQLVQLMDKPEPGCFTWCAAVQECMVNLDRYTNQWMEN